MLRDALRPTNALKRLTKGTATYMQTLSTRTLKSDDSVLTDRTDDSYDLEPIIDSVLHCDDVHIPTDISRSSFYSTHDVGD